MPMGGWLGPERLCDGHGHRVTCRRKAKCELSYIAAEFFDLRESGPSADLLRGQQGGHKQTSTELPVSAQGGPTTRSVFSNL
jgi:hypothetical protein